jgi:hypothetical protein
VRTLGWIAVVGAGVGWLLFTDKGRGWLNRVGEYLQEAYGRVQDCRGGRSRVEMIVRDAVKHDPPDTAVAHAFEEAVA